MTIILVPPISLLLARSLIGFLKRLRNPAQSASSDERVRICCRRRCAGRRPVLLLTPGPFRLLLDQLFQGHSFDMAKARDLLAFRLTRSFDEWRFLKMTLGAAALLALFLFGRLRYLPLGRWTSHLPSWQPLSDSRLPRCVNSESGISGCLPPTFPTVLAISDAWSLVKAEYSGAARHVPGRPRSQR